MITAGVLLVVSIVGWLIIFYANKSNGRPDVDTTISTKPEISEGFSTPITTGLGRTPLYARTRKKIDELEHMLINEKLMPWRLLHSGKPFKVTDYYGKTIRYQGIKFTGSPRAVFWGNYIEPFLENGIVEVLDATAEDCRTSGLEPKPYLEEAANLLMPLIRRVYDYMSETDRRLSGKDYPERTDLSDKIAKMNRLLEEHTAATLLLFSESERFKEKSSPNIRRSRTSIEPEEAEADVNRPGLSPLIKVPEVSIVPEGTAGEVNEPKKVELIKRKEKQIEPEDK